MLGAEWGEGVIARLGKAPDVCSLVCALIQPW